MIRTNPANFPPHTLLALPLAAVLLASCGGSKDEASPKVTASRAAACITAACSGIEGSGTRDVPPPPAPHSHGRFIGTVKIANTMYFADALVTVDGAVRLFVGDPGGDNGVLQFTQPKLSQQFVGTVTPAGTTISGTGVVFGQYCADIQTPGPYCGSNTPAEIHLTIGPVPTNPDTANLRGDAQVGGTNATTWSVDLDYWPNYYRYPAGSLAGHYQEQIAEFAANGDTIITIDANGSLFFQSVRSGCVGSGLLRKHLDGQYGVYDMSLTLANCKAPYTRLNGEYAGLAADSASNFWDYDDELRIWLTSTTPGRTAPALTMLAAALY